MQGIHHFIIQAENLYNDTFKTESGVELYGNVDFTAERQSNRVVKVISTPAKLQTEIKKGYELLIDFTPFYRQIYNGVKQGYQNIADKDKHWYWLEPSMIICYKSPPTPKGGVSEWVGYGENSLVKPILEENTIKTSLLLPNSEAKKFTGKVEMIYANKELKEQGVKNGNTLYMDIKGGVKYWIDGKEYWWVRNRDLLGLEVRK